MARVLEQNAILDTLNTKKMYFLYAKLRFLLQDSKKVVTLHRDFGIRHITTFRKRAFFHGCIEVFAAGV